MRAAHVISAVAALRLIGCAAAREPSAPIQEVAVAPPPLQLQQRAEQQPAPLPRVHETERRAPSAAELQQARELFRQGLEAFQQGQYDEACASFRRAYEIAPRAPMLYNLAQCELRRGDTQAACEHLSQWIDETKPAGARLQEAKQAFRQCPAALFP